MWKLKWLLPVVLAAWIGISPARALDLKPVDGGMKPWPRDRNGFPIIPGMPGGLGPVNPWRGQGPVLGGNPFQRGVPDQWKNGANGPPLRLDLPKITIPPSAMDVKFQDLSRHHASDNWFSRLPGNKGIWVGLLLAGLAGVFHRQKPAGK
jgi:hypothetical protein